jgi:hypothetical protein
MHRLRVSPYATAKALVYLVARARRKSGREYRGWALILKATKAGCTPGKKYLCYQIEIIADTNNQRKENELRHRIWNYINYYGFKDVNKLYKEMGYDIGVTTRIEH